MGQPRHGDVALPQFGQHLRRLFPAALLRQPPRGLQQPPAHAQLAQSR
jgi:hypothetical protein